jgi:hypothetical protein
MFKVRREARRPPDQRASEPTSYQIEVVTVLSPHPAARTTRKTIVEGPFLELTIWGAVKVSLTGDVAANGAWQPK